MNTQAAARARRAADETDPLEYPWEHPPAPATTREVAPGVRWVRMPLPFVLDHINLWLLDGEDGWCAVDTGLGGEEVKELWRRLFATELAGRPLGSIVATHFHPDHFGLAGWLAREHRAGLYMTRTEWLTAAFIAHDTEAVTSRAQGELFARHGVGEERCTAFAQRGNNYRRLITSPPPYRRLCDGMPLECAGGRWRVWVATGHSPEHACLYSASLGVLIAGDQVLPRISPNVSLWPNEPEADPLGEYLSSIARLRELPADTLVLPSHGLPFHGLHRRIDALVAHHEERLARLVEHCARPRTAFETLGVLFDRDLGGDLHQLLFAMGESLSHLAHLERRGALVREVDGDGVIRFAAAGR